MLTLVIVIITIFLTGYFAGIETGCYTLSRLKLFYKVNTKECNAITLKGLLHEPQKFVFMTLICQNIFVYITSSMVTYYYLENHIVGEKIRFVWGILPWSAEIAATLTLIFPLFIFAEVGPKNLFLNYADVLMYKTVRIQQVCFWLCKPLVWILTFLSNMLPGSKSEPEHSFDEMNVHKLKIFFTESSHDGVITGLQNEMINKVMMFQNTGVTRFMKHLNQLFMLQVDGGSGVWLTELKKNSNKYNDIPVYSKNRKNVIGTANFFDVLNAVERKYESLKPCVQQLIKMNNSLNVQQAIELMQKKKKNKSLIVDKKGVILGVVYLKDIVAYITKKGTVK